MPRRIFSISLCLCALFVVGACKTGASGSGPKISDSEVPVSYQYTVVGPEGAVVARAITSSSTCPKIEVDGVSIVMKPRIDSEVPCFTQVLVCEHVIAKGAGRASIEGQDLALLQERVERVVIIGDTGCRVIGARKQDCADSQAWPYSRIAAMAAKESPDLVVHLGDLHYREGANPNPNNCGKPSAGYNWPVWDADFFEPSGELLTRAPWVLTRGNHENCDRAWKGWFYLLDPYPWHAVACVDYSEPYGISLGDMDLLMMDTAVVPNGDREVDADALPVYDEMFARVGELVSEGRPAVLATHRPIWAVVPGGDKVYYSSHTLAEAVKQGGEGSLPEQILATFVGHVHALQFIDFDDARPSTALIGSSGTELSRSMPQNLAEVGAEVLEQLAVTADEVQHFEEFGYGLLSRSDDGWLLEYKTAPDEVLLSYTLPIPSAPSE